MCPDFVKLCAEARRNYGLKEVRYASYEEHVVVAVQGTASNMVGIMVPYGLKVG